MLVTAMQLRMNAFIADESGNGFQPVVVVAGETANAAFKLFSLVAVSEDQLCGVRVARFNNFTALLDAPHPSAHLRTGCAPQPCALFRTAFQLACRLNLQPSSTREELLEHVSEYEKMHEDACRVQFWSCSWTCMVAWGLGLATT